MRTNVVACAAAFPSNGQQNWNVKGSSKHEDNLAAAWSWVERISVKRIKRVLPVTCVRIALARQPGQCINPSVDAQLMHTRHASEPIPLIAAPLAPPRYPILSMSFLCMRAVVQTAPRHPSLVAFVVRPGIHIALLSSHRVCPRGRLCPREIALRQRLGSLAAG